MVDGVALGVGATLREVVARIHAGSSSAFLLDGAVVVEVATLLALPCAPQWPIGTDLAEGAIGVASASRSANVLLAVFPSQAVSVVETDLDAHLLVGAGLLRV